MAGLRSLSAPRGLAAVTGERVGEMIIQYNREWWSSKTKEEQDSEDGSRMARKGAQYSGSINRRRADPGRPSICTQAE